MSKDDDSYDNFLRYVSPIEQDTRDFRIGDDATAKPPPKRRHTTRHTQTTANTNKQTADTTTYPLKHPDAYPHEPRTYVQADDTLTYRQSGVNTKQFSELRRGMIPIDRRLDLHGQTSVEAHSALHHTLANACEQSQRLLLIIHGKGKSRGQPVLKSLVNEWLRENAHVLAFHSAQPKHGGRGAVYVLLRRFAD